MSAPALPWRLFAATAAIVVAIFALCAVVETVVLQLRLESAKAQREADRLTSVLRFEGSRVDSEREIEKEISALHLADSPALQCAAMLTTLESVSRRNALDVIAIRRERGNPSPAKRWIADVYELTIDGTYPSLLVAFSGLANAALITNVRSVAFERHQTNQRSRVRATIQLEVYRMGRSDVPLDRS